MQRPWQVGIPVQVHWATVLVVLVWLVSVQVIGV